MEEFESQTERVEEDLHHHAAHATGHGERWVSGVALTAALLAAMAAVAALLSGHHANDAMLERMRASDDWAFYQAKSIKASIVETRIDAREAAGAAARDKDRQAVERYEREQQEIRARAETEEDESRGHFATHTTLAKAVTLFQVAIAVSAVSALTRRRAFWFVGIGLGLVGVVFLVLGLLPARHAAGGEGTHEAGRAPAGHATLWVRPAPPV